MGQKPQSQWNYATTPLTLSNPWGRLSVHRLYPSMRLMLFWPHSWLGNVLRNLQSWLLLLQRGLHLKHLWHHSFRHHLD